MWIFPVVLSCIFLGIHILAYFSIVKPIRFKSVRIIFAIFLVCNFLGIEGYFYARYLVGLPHFIFYLLSISIGIGFVLLLASILLWFLRGVNWLLFSKQKDREANNKVWIRSCVILFIIVYSAWGMIEGRMLPRIREVSLSFPNLKQNFTAVQLSDIHIGGLVDAKIVKEMVLGANALKPDVIFLTGDIVDIEINRAKEALAELEKLQAPLGVYYILGNHEYYHNATEIIEYVKTLSTIKLLENSNVILQKNGEDLVNVVGLYDLAGLRFDDRTPDLKAAMQGSNATIPTILLSHQPKSIEYVASWNEETTQKIDLMLSGHTHGGQIFPFKYLVRLAQPYINGLYKDSSGTQVYVNVGSGFWGPPMRVGVRAEMTYYTFTP